MATVPTVVDIYLDRAAVIPDIAAASAALVANFGATDEVLMDLLWGKFKPEGKLPFEMPRSMAAASAQLEDVPYDSQDPIFEFGHGLNYPN
jgi:beta-glucosidase